MAFNIEEMASVIADHLKTFATTQSVVGEPIEIQGKTIIPVIKLKLGFGVGGGEEMEAPKKHGHGGTGGGGGGGASVEPAAFITIIGDEISVLSPKGSKFEKLAEAVPGIISKIMEAHGKKTQESPGEPEEE